MGTNMNALKNQSWVYLVGAFSVSDHSRLSHELRSDRFKSNGFETSAGADKVVSIRRRFRPPFFCQFRGLSPDRRAPAPTTGTWCKSFGFRVRTKAMISSMLSGATVNGVA